MTLRFLVRLVALGWIVTTSLASESQCDNDTDEDGTCASPDAPPDTGMDPMSARILVVSGQIPVPPVCGSWCDNGNAASEPCTMDTAIMPCEGDFGCTTTCALWQLFIQSDGRPSVTCADFAFFVGYPKGATVCDESCLLPELRKERYPLPTGLGLLCQADTCYPSTSSQNPNSPGNLQCPCSWFGSDCDDDWAPLLFVNQTQSYGDLQAITLTVSDADWERIVANHQPGGVIRIVHRDPTNPNIIAEQPYALAYAPAVGQLEVLTNPPDTALDPHPRAVAERLRALPTGPIPLEHPLYVNPSIAGFFNQHYMYLNDFLQQSSTAIDRLVVVSTGAGLSGALSAVEMVPSTVIKQVHLFYGLRRMDELAYRERLNELEEMDKLNLTLLETRGNDDQAKNLAADGIAAALARGHVSRKLADDNSKKLYVQHALGVELTRGALQDVTLESTVFVVCGRMELLAETKEVLKKDLCANDASCMDALGAHYFTNI